MSNTIWILSKRYVNVVTSFEDLSKLGKRQFQSIFKEDNQTTIVDVVRMVGFFPRFVNEEDNQSLMEEVFDEELKEVLWIF